MKASLILGITLALSPYSLLAALTPEQAQVQAEQGYRLATGDGVEVDYTKAIEILTPAAETGNLLAKHTIAIIHVNEHIIDADAKMGLALLIEAAEAGFSRSQQSLAAAYLNGTNLVEADQAKAHYWMQKAAEQGEIDSIRALVGQYMVGEGAVAKDYEKAMYWLEKGATAGDARLQMDLGYQYLNGEIIEADAEKGTYWTRKAAEQGETQAMVNLAMIYKHGNALTEKDDTIAYEWVKKASELGSPRGHNLRAICLLNGDGVEKNEEEGLRYMHMAADQDYAISLLSLSNYYRDGLYGLEADMEMCLTYLRRAVTRGDVQAMKTLSHYYDTGHGVEVNQKLSYQLQKSAAEAGDVESMDALTKRYMNGNGTPVNMEQAILWAERSSEQGGSAGLFNLALIYRYGLAGEADMEKAISYLEKALDAEATLACSLLLEIYASEEYGNEELLQKTLERYAELFEMPSLEHAKQEATLDLAKLYIKGGIVPVDEEKGLSLLVSVAEAGYARAQATLADYLINNADGKKEDVEKAMSLLEQAANQGLASAYGDLINLYTAGYKDVLPDAVKAFYWMEKAASAGMPEFQLELALRYLHGVDVEADGKKAFDWFLKAAEQGNVVAMRHVANTYYNGNESIAKDADLAYEWAKKTAALGDASATNLLAICYLLGIGTEKNEEEGLRCMRAAADMMHTGAISNLSYYYLHGEHGLTPDPQMAFSYCLKAAEAGAPSSMVDLAIIHYIEGVGVVPNKELAFEWMKKAAELRHPLAMSNLSYFYRKGEGVETDYEQAYIWAERAMRRGLPAGAFNLALLYLNGLGRDVDMEKGVDLLEDAAGHGEKDAYDTLLEIFTSEEFSDPERVQFYKEHLGKQFSDSENAES